MTDTELQERIAELELENAGLKSDRQNTWEEYARCANTPLMADVMWDRDQARALADRLAAAVLRVKNAHDRVQCEDHLTLRHPLCRRCRLDARIEDCEPILAEWRAAGRSGIDDLYEVQLVKHLQERIVTLEADKARLDWLEQAGISTVLRMLNDGPDSGHVFNTKRWRAALDSAMKESK